MLRRYIASVAALLALLLIGGCGGGEGGPSSADTAGTAQTRTDADTETAKAAEPATLVLDFLPGPVHAGIYYAQQEGFYEEAGIDLRIIEPTSTADTLKLIDAGKAEFGIADSMDVAIQIDQGREARAIMALTQRPSGGLITRRESGFGSLADLKGARIGVTGVPSDGAVLETLLADGGLRPRDVEVVTIGFNGVQHLENGKIDGFIGYIPADGVQMEVDGHEIRSFPFDEHGGPSYPGLVVFSTGSVIEAAPDLMQAFVDATRRGYEAVIKDPASGVEALLAHTKGIPPELADAGLAAYEELFLGDAPKFGVLREQRVAQLMDFMAEAGLTKRRVAPGRFFTAEFTGG